LVGEEEQRTHKEFRSELEVLRAWGVHEAALPLVSKYALSIVELVEEVRELRKVLEKLVEELRRMRVDRLPFR